ncbi:MAG: hypothetical protein GX250_08605 [Clostridiales bacterium]|nr:hypothetical protein [Clostridiales bacterium]
MNNITLNDSTIKSMASAGMKRQQVLDASLMGLGALSFADILLMLFSPATMNAYSDAQTDSQTDAGENLTQQVTGVEAPTIPELFNEVAGNQAVGTDALAFIRTETEPAAFIKAETEIEIETESPVISGVKTEPLYFRQMIDLTDEVEAALQPEVPQKAQLPAQAPTLPTETAVAPAFNAPASAFKELFSTQSETPIRTEAAETLALNFEVASLEKPDPKGEPWEALYRTAGELKLRLGRDPAVDTEEIMQDLKAAELVAQNPKEIMQTTERLEVIQQDYALSKQISTGISERLKEGKSEFTIKLRPEKLGEITVKLIEESGKMTLRIETVRSETARLINNDLSALREAVRPMQVEVHEAVTPSPDSSPLSFHQFSAGGQQHFSDSQQQCWGQTASPAYKLSTDSAETTSPQSLSSQGLDRYV